MKTLNRLALATFLLAGAMSAHAAAGTVAAHWPEGKDGKHLQMMDETCTPWHFNRVGEVIDEDSGSGMRVMLIDSSGSVLGRGCASHGSGEWFISWDNHKTPTGAYADSSMIKN
jgi:hypothetical protein